MALTQVTSIGLKDGEIVNADLHSAASVALSKLASTGALGSAVTATTQSASDDSTKLATTAFVQAAVTSLIDGAPGSLNTLNELAAAINDDSSYATTLTTALATKLPLAGGTLTGTLNIGNGSITTGSNFSLNGNALTVTGSSGTVIEGKRAGSATIQATNTTDSTDLQLRADATGGLVRTASNKPLLLGTNQQERLRITSGGSVNIGGDYTQTSKKFKVTGNSTFDGGLHVTGLLEGGSGFSIINGNLTLPAYIYHDADSDTYYGFSSADQFSVFTGGTEKLKITSSAATIKGTTDGVLNLDTTDSRGTFIRFQQGGTTKHWIGCGQGLSLGDLDDLGITATDNIRMRTGSHQRILIKGNGKVTINPYNTFHSPTNGEPTLTLSNESESNLYEGGKWSHAAIGLHNTTHTANGGSKSQIVFGYLPRSGGYDFEYGSAYIGATSRSQSGAGFVDLVFGTKHATSDIQPKERLRITSGGIQSYTGSSADNHYGEVQVRHKTPYSTDGSYPGGSQTSTNQTVFSLYNESYGGNKMAFRSGQGHQFEIESKTRDLGSGSYNDADIYFRAQYDGSLSDRYIIDAHGGHTFKDRSGNTGLNVDSSGRVTRPLQPSFSAYKSGSGWTVNANTEMVFDAARHNAGTHYSTSTGRFTAPRTGSYFFSFYTIFNTNVNSASVKIYKNGARLYGGDIHFTFDQSGHWHNVSFSQVIQLASNDYVSIFNGGTQVQYHGNHWQLFSGYLLG